MNDGRLLVLMAAALVSSLSVGCAHAAPAPVVAPEVAPFSNDADVPLVAPDEGRTSASPRLTKAKTIGGGDDGASYALGASNGQVGQATTTTSSDMWRPSPTYGYRGRAVYTRGYSRGYSRGGTDAVVRGNAAGPPVGGNFPTVPSFGPAAQR